MNNVSANFKSILETLSALAVVLSLVFVGVQMNENTKSTRSAIAAETTATISEWYSSVGADAETARIFRNFISDPQSLSVDEQYQAVMTLHSLSLILQSSFYLEDEGTLDPKIRESLGKALIGYPGLHFYWEQRKDLFTNERFITFFEQVLAGDRTHSQALYGTPDE